MKRILTLGIVLALMAALVIPAAVIANGGDTTDVTGSIAGATISLTAPDPIGLGMLVWGDNKGNSTGSVNVTAYSWNPDDLDFSVSAVDEKVADTGYMTDTSDNPLASGKLLISPDDWTSQAEADTAIEWEWTGENEGEHDFTLYVNQVIDAVEEAGDYTITITFTAQIDTLP